MTNSQKMLAWIVGGGILAYLFYNRQTVVDTVTAALSGWKSVGSGPQWIPYLNAAEAQYNIPTDLLARMAYRESIHFREDVIRGMTASPAGALGLMQLEPAFFNTVNVPRPYTDEDVLNQIAEAARDVVAMYTATKQWPLAIAAYNAGLGNVHKYGGIPPFTETQNYVADMLANVPSLASVA